MTSHNATQTVRDQHRRPAAEYGTRTKLADCRTELDQNDPELWCEYGLEGGYLGCGGYEMEGSKEALEDFAREAVALYSRDAAKMLLHRADIADEYGDEVAAKTWRQVAAIASRITRRLRSM